MMLLAPSTIQRQAGYLSVNESRTWNQAILQNFWCNPAKSHLRKRGLAREQAYAGWEFTIYAGIVHRIATSIPSRKTTTDYTDNTDINNSESLSVPHP